MTNQERAEKIVVEVLDRQFKSSVNLIDLVTSHLDEAVLFAVEEDRKSWDAQHALDLKLHVEQAVREAIEHHHFTEKCCDACFDSGRDKGFAAAREQAAGIVRALFFQALGKNEEAATWLAERIRAMTPTVPGEADK